MRGAAAGALLLAMVLGVTACGRGTTPVPVDYFVGPDGVTLTPLDGPALDPVYDDSEVELAVEIENKGAYDLASLSAQQYALLFVTYDPRYLVFVLDQFVWPSEGFELWHDPARPGEVAISQIFLLGKSAMAPRGDREVAQIPFRIPPLSGEQGVVNTQAIFTACYPYKTRFAKDLCMDADIYSIDERQKVCRSLDRDFVSQGAPVAVAHIEPRIGKQGGYLAPVFVVTLQDVGGGLLFDYHPTPGQTVMDLCTADRATNLGCDVLCRVSPDRCAACRLQQRDAQGFNRARVTARLSGVPLDCGNGLEPALVKFVDNTAKVRCKVLAADASAFEMQATNYFANLEVDVLYGYKVSLSKPIKIVRA